MAKRKISVSRIRRVFGAGFYAGLLQARGRKHKNHRKTSGRKKKTGKR